MPVVPVIRQPVGGHTQQQILCVYIGCTVANLASENIRLLFISQTGGRGATATFQPSPPRPVPVPQHLARQCTTIYKNDYAKESSADAFLGLTLY